mgnify:FL=1
MDRQITKIKVKKGSYFFAWEEYQSSTANWDGHTLTCKDKPRDELLAAMKALAPHVLDICEFVKENIEDFMVSGVTWSYTEDNQYVTLTAQKKLEYSRAPLILNTPVRPEEPGKDDDMTFCMSEELMDDLRKLEADAWRYIMGDRAQQQLDFADTEDESEPQGIGA